MRMTIKLLLGALLIGVYFTSSEACCGRIYSGNKVGLRYPYQTVYWLSCYHQVRCERSNCPGVLFSTGQAHCSGEIFRMYKRRGSGTIRIGDEVGLYYLGSKTWMSAWDNDGGVSKCPGEPSIDFGMNTVPGKCKGEVFRVYAVGKSLGEPLNNKDYIMLHYPHGGNQWISLNGGTMRKITCPGSSYPPPESKYQACAAEVFQVWKLNF
jgi:hypothetical protein